MVQERNCSNFLPDLVPSQLSKRHNAPRLRFDSKTVEERKAEPKPSLWARLKAHFQFSRLAWFNELTKSNMQKYEVELQLSRDMHGSLVRMQSPQKNEEEGFAGRLNIPAYPRLRRQAFPDPCLLRQVGRQSSRQLLRHRFSRSSKRIQQQILQPAP
jgi:hypothetical protein